VGIGFSGVVPALVADIHGLGNIHMKDVDGRDKPGHDEIRAACCKCR
jgi:hypothetical protein